MEIQNKKSKFKKNKIVVLFFNKCNPLVVVYNLWNLVLTNYNFLIRVNTRSGYQWVYINNRIALIRVILQGSVPPSAFRSYDGCVWWLHAGETIIHTLVVCGLDFVLFMGSKDYLMKSFHTIIMWWICVLLVFILYMNFCLLALPSEVKRHLHR
jgi:hypothetical protein